MLRLLWCLLVFLCVCPASAQDSKLSPFLRQLVQSEKCRNSVECRTESVEFATAIPIPADAPARSLSGEKVATDGMAAANSTLYTLHSTLPQVCAFVRINGSESEEILGAHGSKSLAHWGDIHIAMIPLSQLTALAAEPAVSRIEANRPCKAQMDTTAIAINAMPVYEGYQLPQAYTGRGVVMGVMDIGFDLTHPNFYSADLSDYRIRRFWDQIALEQNMEPVGAEYTDEASILAVAHSRDGLDQTHGTHTLGIAAGSGYDSPYRGMAYESDICLVSNATTDDIELIDSADLYKYTSATDALGFKYIFDYAESQGLPCVISFSEGGPQSFSEEEQLYFEVLDSLTGPGRIIVAAAGNAGGFDYCVPKPRGKELAGTYILDLDKDASFAARGDAPYTLRVVAYLEGEEPDTMLIHPFSDPLAPDTIIHVFPRDVTLKACCYHSFYNPQDMAVEVGLKGPDSWKDSDWIGLKPEMSLEVIGEEADAQLLLQDGYFLGGENYDVIHDDAVGTHSIHSPGASPSVICVGATSYRTGNYNYLGHWRSFDQGTEGERAAYSSVGPTFDGRTKPDVMAPGTNIISSYSSYYCENHPTASDTYSNVSSFDFNGRTYFWNSNAGTSMSTPVVAGAIALWLQAKPDLTPEQALDVISHTARHYTDTLAYPNNYYGYGEIDVYAGLLEVLQLNVIDGISHHQPTAARISLLPDRKLLITLSSEEFRTERVEFKLSLYDLSGQKVWSTTSPLHPSPFILHLPAGLSGVYAVQLDGVPGITGSTLIRL